MEFNLEKWQRGAKVTTRNGEPVEYLIHFPNVVGKMFAGLVDGGTLFTWYSNGNFLPDGEQSEFDLVVQEEEMWVYVFRSLGTKVLSFKIYPSATDALAAYTEKHSQKDLIGVFKLTEL